MYMYSMVAILHKIFETIHVAGLSLLHCGKKGADDAKRRQLLDLKARQYQQPWFQR